MGNPYRKRRVIIVRYVIRRCSFIVVNMYNFVFVGIVVDVDSIVLNMYYFVIVDVNVNFDGIIEGNNIWLGKDVFWKVRFVRVDGKSGLRVRFMVVLIVRKVIRMGTKIFESR